MGRLVALAPLALALATAVGCADSSKTHDPKRDAPASDVDVASNVVVLQRTPGIDVTVEADRLTVASAGADDVRALTPGDIAVSGLGHGFIRRVVSLNDDGANVVVETQPATLTDAIRRGSYHHQTGAAGVKALSADGSIDGVSLDFSGTSIVSTDHFAVSVPEGHLEFSPVFDLDIDIGWNGLEHFKAAATGAIDAGITLQLDVTNATIRGSYTHDLWSKSYPFAQMIGPVPVVEVVEMSVGVGVQVDFTGSASLTTGGSLQANLAAGAEFADGQWHAIGDHYVQLQPVPVQFSGSGDVSGVRGFVYLDLAVKLYDVAGVAVSINPYVGVFKDVNGHWGPAVGIWGEFDGRVSLPIIDKDWNPYAAYLFDVRTEFPADSDGSETGGDTGGQDACGGVTYEGSCQDGVAIYCDGLNVQYEDCASYGQGCGWAGDDVGYYCVDGCGDLDFAGACSGDGLRYCDGGQVIAIDCGGQGLSCGYSGDEGVFDCL